MLSHASVPLAGHAPFPADLVYLIRAEYREMPGLSVTLEQAARLWNVERRACLDALETLTREGFLYRCGPRYLRTGRG
jgi:hypothetical protein